MLNILIFGYIIGIILFKLISLKKVLIILIIIFLSGYCFLHFCYRVIDLKTAIIFSLAILFGGFWSYKGINYGQVFVFNQKLVNKNIDITGRINSISIENAVTDQFEMSVLTLNHQPANFRVRLNWYQNPQPLLLGTVWHLTIRIKPPHGLQNPGGFNYENWLWLENIQATGYVVSIGKNYLINRKQDFIDYIRQKIQKNINHSVSNSQIAALLCALTVGIRSGFTEDMWRVLQNTGTNHLVVIAGLHLEIMVSLIFFALRYGCCLFPRLLIYYPAQTIAGWGSLVFAWLYGLLSGFLIPTQRALLMITVFVIGSQLNRSSSIFFRLLLAAALVLFVTPLSLFSASFWLSFGACICIAYGMFYRQSTKTYLKFNWVKLQLVITFGLIPLTLLFFNQFSFSSLVANLIAIPIVGFMVVPLGLIGSLLTFVYQPGSNWLFHHLQYLLLPVWQLLIKLSSFQNLIWYHSILNPWIFITAVFAFLLFLAPKKFPGRILGFFWLLPLLCYRLPTPQKNELWLSMLDVGQGLAIVIRTSAHSMIYDTGPSSAMGFDAGKDIIIPYLRYENIRKIDLLVVSHGDNDHSGGVKSILKTFKIDQLVSSKPNLFKPFQTHPCYSGQTWYWEGWQFEFLSPPRNQPYLDNNSSCVLKITDQYQRSAILLTGDIQKQVELLLIKKYNKKLKAQVLIVPHHGSLTSSSRLFLEKVHPQYALFSLGFLNRYHFPSSEVLARYRAISAITYFTAYSGAINLELSPFQPIKVQTMNKFSYNLISNLNCFQDCKK